MILTLSDDDVGKVLRYPPGTLIGPNGITLRPGTGDKGPRIYIPEKGPKLPETLHYP